MSTENNFSARAGCISNKRQTSKIKVTLDMNMICHACRSPNLQNRNLTFLKYSISMIGPKGDCSLQLGYGDNRFQTILLNKRTNTKCYPSSSLLFHDTSSISTSQKVTHPKNCNWLQTQIFSTFSATPMVSSSTRKRYQAMPHPNNLR